MPNPALLACLRATQPMKSYSAWDPIALMHSVANGANWTDGRPDDQSPAGLAKIPQQTPVGAFEAMVRLQRPVVHAPPLMTFHSQVLAGLLAVDAALERYVNSERQLG